MIDAPGTASLDVERRDHPTRRFVLATSPFRIGRAPESELHVPDGHVSKQHAEIVREGPAFVLIDTGSRAGVMVNGQPVQRHSLTSGDTIELGASSPVRITFRLTKVERPNLLEMTMMSVVKDPAEGGMSRLARFFEFSHKLGGGFSLEEVLRDVVDLAIEVTGAERGMLIVRRPDDSLETKVARANGARSLPIDGLKVSETIVRKALAHGKPSTVDDVGQDTDLALAASIVSLELRSAVTLPLLQIT
nr:FHA domain-containing protein [Planctomycetota bacterium]